MRHEPLLGSSAKPWPPVNFVQRYTRLESLDGARLWVERVYLCTWRCVYVVGGGLFRCTGSPESMNGPLAIGAEDCENRARSFKHIWRKGPSQDARCQRRLEVCIGVEPKAKQESTKGRKSIGSSMRMAVHSNGNEGRPSADSQQSARPCTERVCVACCLLLATLLARVITKADVVNHDASAASANTASKKHIVSWFWHLSTAQSKM